MLKAGRHRTSRKVTRLVTILFFDHYIVHRLRQRHHIPYLAIITQGSSLSIGRYEHYRDVLKTHPHRHALTSTNNRYHVYVTSYNLTYMHLQVLATRQVDCITTTSITHLWRSRNEYTHFTVRRYTTLQQSSYADILSAFRVLVSTCSIPSAHVRLEGP